MEEEFNVNVIENKIKIKHGLNIELDHCMKHDSLVLRSKSQWGLHPNGENQQF
jgi:hypothetical protein